MGENSDLSPLAKAPTEVDILLAVHNGESYLDELLKSLTKQEDAIINLHISLDSCTDSSYQIIRNWELRFNKVFIYTTNFQDHNKNFLFLLSKSRGEFIAFCDQDDIWQPQHLAIAISKMQNRSIPSLTFSKVLEFSSNGKPRTWPLFDRIPDFPVLLFENIARGCTQVINRRAKEEILASKMPDQIHFDWWVFQLIWLRGQINFIPTVQVLYRLHEANAVGANRGVIPRLLRARKGIILQGFWQFKSVLLRNEWSLSERELEIMKRFDRAINSRFLNRLKLVIDVSYRFRTKPLDDILYRVFLLFAKNEPKNKDLHQWGQK